MARYSTQNIHNTQNNHKVLANRKNRVVAKLPPVSRKNNILLKKERQKLNPTLYPKPGADSETKKKLRMIRNRESAALSRKKKQERLLELEDEVIRLREENENLISQLSHLKNLHPEQQQQRQQQHQQQHTFNSTSDPTQNSIYTLSPLETYITNNNHKNNHQMNITPDEMTDNCSMTSSLSGAGEVFGNNNICNEEEPFFYDLIDATSNSYSSGTIPEYDPMTFTTKDSELDKSAYEQYLNNHKQAMFV